MKNKFVISKNDGKELTLEVSLEGELQICFGYQCFTVASQVLEIVDDSAYLTAYLDGNSGVTFMMKVRDKSIVGVSAFLSYWKPPKLEEVKQEKWQSFLAYLGVITSFVNENFNTDVNPVYVTTEYHEDCGTCNEQMCIELLVGVVDIGDEMYSTIGDLCMKLSMNLLQHEQEDDFKYGWHSRISTLIRPKIDWDSYLENELK